MLSTLYIYISWIPINDGEKWRLFHWLFVFKNNLLFSNDHYFLTALVLVDSLKIIDAKNKYLSFNGIYYQPSFSQVGKINSRPVNDSQSQQKKERKDKE